MKFYYISYWYDGAIGYRLINEFPLEFNKRFNGEKGKPIIISWNEITKEEYDKYL